MILSSSVYTDTLGNLYIVGEVENQGSSNVRFVRIDSDLYNGGFLVGTRFSYTQVDVVAPSERACFAVLFFDPPAAWTDYALTVDYSLGGTESPDLVLFNDSGSYVANFGWYDVIGQIRNDGPSQSRFVNAVGTLYDAQGTVLDCRFGYVNSTDLAPGQTSSFRIMYTRRGADYLNVARHSLRAQGSE